MSDCQLIQRNTNIFGIDFEVYTIDGEEFISMPQFARGIGYGTARPLHKLIGRHASEFVNKTRVVNLDTVQNQQVTVINREGVIRACMLAHAPRAKEFRDVAEHILFKVLTNDPYNPAALSQILKQMNETLRLQGNMVQNLAAEVHEMREWRAQTFIPAQADNSYWPTPTERLRTILPSLHRLPAYFNRGGSFDIYCTLRHAQSRGGLLSQRNRRSRGKMPDYVIQPCPENDQFLREALEVWLISEFPNQAKLKLLVSNRDRATPGAPQA